MLHFDNGIIQLYQSDARNLPIPDNSVDCVVTSPPYWGLRDYNTDGQLGLEETPEEWVVNMVAVFREVWRVLKPTGTVWMNLGDNYAGNPHYAGGAKGDMSNLGGFSRGTRYSVKGNGIKPKDLIGQPWKVAFALQADGWYLRSDIIWSKPNPMPESARDRPTKAHEYVFLLTKSPRYYYDADAIRERHADWERGAHGERVGSGDDERPQPNVRTGTFNAKDRHGADRAYNPSGRNKRTVWEIPTQPYPEAHFATYPEKLVEPCILAGTSEKGVCSECGKPWEREVELTEEYASLLASGKAWQTTSPLRTSTNNIKRPPKQHPQNQPPKHNTIGWQPTCECNADTVPATVLDPFVGSGTTLAVAQRLGRKGIGTDISKEYLQLAEKRICDIPLPMSMFG